MPYSDGSPTLSEQIEADMEYREITGPLLKEANEMAAEIKALQAANEALVDLLQRVLSHGLDEGESVSHDYHSVSAPSAKEKKSGTLEIDIRAAIANATKQ